MSARWAPLLLVGCAQATVAREVPKDATPVGPGDAESLVAEPPDAESGVAAASDAAADDAVESAADAGVEAGEVAPTDAGQEVLDAGAMACCTNEGTFLYCTDQDACPDYYACGDAGAVLGLPPGRVACVSGR
jgi:hypothetical protein